MRYIYKCVYVTHIYITCPHKESAYVSVYVYMCVHIYIHIYMHRYKISYYSSFSFNIFSQIIKCISNLL